MVLYLRKVFERTPEDLPPANSVWIVVRLKQEETRTDSRGGHREGLCGAHRLLGSVVDDALALNREESGSAPSWSFFASRGPTVKSESRRPPSNAFRPSGLRGPLHPSVFLFLGKNSKCLFKQNIQLDPDWTFFFVIL